MHHITASTRTTASMFHPLETSPSHKCQATVLHPFSANLLQGFQVTPREYTLDCQISIDYQFNEVFLPTRTYYLVFSLGINLGRSINLALQLFNSPE